MKIYGVNKKKDVSNERKVRRAVICLMVIAAMILALIVLKPHNNKATDPKVALQEQMEAGLDSLLTLEAGKGNFILPYTIDDTGDIQHIRILPPCPFEDEKANLQMRLRSLEILYNLKKDKKTSKEIDNINDRLMNIDQDIVFWKADTLNILDYNCRRVRFTDGNAKKFVCFQCIDKRTGAQRIDHLFDIIENQSDDAQKLLNDIME